MPDKKVKKITKDCEGCIRVLDDRTCAGWTEPKWKWRNGYCPEFSIDKDEAEILQKIGMG